MPPGERRQMLAHAASQTSDRFPEASAEPEMKETGRRLRCMDAKVSETEHWRACYQDYLRARYESPVLLSGHPNAAGYQTRPGTWFALVLVQDFNLPHFLQTFDRLATAMKRSEIGCLGVHSNDHF
jgi:hypothetical protein